MKKLQQNKQKFLIILSVVAFCVGLIIAVFLYNKQHENRNQNIEITFISPQQAVIFWTTQQETKGYVKYSTNKRKLDQKKEQTSSTAGKTHAVVLEDIPLEGVFVSLHNESDSWLLFPTVTSVVFNPETFIE